MITERFLVDIQGTSHGEGITTRIDDCPPDILIDEAFIQQELDRRRPGQAYTSERQESDEFVFRSGISPDGFTTGETIEVFVPNRGQHSAAYDKLANLLRPGHGITMQILKAMARGEQIETAGGGQASARLTVGDVAAGAIAQLALNQLIDGRQVEVLACIEQMGTNTRALIETDDVLTEDMIYASPVRCPNRAASQVMERLLQNLLRVGDSVGASVYCRTTGFPGAIGERPGISLDERIAGAMDGINAVKGVIIGDKSPHLLFGSDYIDEIIGFSGTDLLTSSNHAGGILGGMSMGGQPIEAHILFKPTGSMRRKVLTVDLDNVRQTITLGEDDRHDPCVAIRGAEVVKAIMRKVLIQAYLAEQP